MILYRGSPRPGVPHSRIRLQRSHLNEESPQRWGEVTEWKQWVAALSGIPASHPGKDYARALGPADTHVLL